jgi:hypothetical protein
MEKLILAVDFDGTIVTHKFPQIGEPLPFAFECLRVLKADGHKLILWTCRENHKTHIDKQYLTDAVEYCRENGVEFDAVNETIAQEDFRYEYYKLMRKPYAHIYIDDSNLGGFPGWLKVMEIVEGEYNGSGVSSLKFGVDQNCNHFGFVGQKTPKT